MVAVTCERRRNGWFPGVGRTNAAARTAATATTAAAASDIRTKALPYACCATYRSWAPASGGRVAARVIASAGVPGSVWR